MSVERAVPSFRDYFTIKEAAEFLGVSPDTLRNWDDAGKLPAIRHPVNGYRLYEPQTLKNLLARTVRGKQEIRRTLGRPRDNLADRQPGEP